MSSETMSAGAIIQPMRQPVMPWLFDMELSTIVRSAMPGSAAARHDASPASDQ